MSEQVTKIFKISKDLDRDLKYQAIDEGKTQSAVIREALEKYLSKQAEQSIDKALKSFGRTSEDEY